MTIDTGSRRCSPATLMAGLAISALVVIGSFAAPASAASSDQQNLPYWSSPYYTMPPVGYGWPYGYGYYVPPYPYYGWPYYAPPVFYR